MNQIILQSLRDFTLELYEPIIPRMLDLGEPLQPKAGNLVKVVTGMRRSGKSYRLMQEMKRIQNQGIPASRMLYFNFEDDRLRPVTTATGDEVLEAFEFLSPGCFLDGCYLFLDELQEMENWGAWLRRVVDTKRATVYVSGSSSKMLSSEIATEFRGRALDFELLPFSFSEYAAHMLPDIDVNAKAFRSDEIVRLKALLSAYLEEGGFPTTFDLPRAQATELLQSYVQRVVSRDVVERHDVSRPRVASLFAQRVLGRNGRQISVRKTANDLKSAGISTSRDTLSDMLSYFEEAYFIFQVRELSYALSENTTALPKLYAIDPGLARANAQAATNDAGQRLENAVYLELRRRTPGLRRGGIASMHTKAHSYEIDFVVGDALEQQARELYQVSLDVEDEKALERELRALCEAMDEQNIEESYLIVAQGNEHVNELEVGRVVQIPAWKWLLKG